MSYISVKIKNNKLYACLAVFILAVNVMLLASWMGHRSVQVRADVRDVGTAPPERASLSAHRRGLFDDEEMAANRKKMEVLAMDEPIMYFFLAIVNLTILFVILAGFILDVYLAARAFRKRPVDIRIAEIEKPLWTLSDVIRVVIIFLFSGYMFVIAQSLAARYFPLFSDPNFRMIFDTAVMSVAALSVIFYFIRKKYGQSIGSIGLAKVSVLKSLFIGAAGYIAFVPVIFVIMLGTFVFIRLMGYDPPVQPIVGVFMEEEKVSILVMASVFAAVFGPVAEEIFFRGFMYPAVKKQWGMAAGILGTSVLFSFLHMHAVGFLPILALGIMLTYLYEKTGTILVPIAVHIIHNLGMVGLVFLMRRLG